MSNQFLLPCTDCSKKLTVGVVQAGETVHCECGAEILVPKLRDLRQLPAAATNAARTKPSGWSHAQGLVFVIGALLLTAGVLTHFRISPQREALDTARPEAENIQVEQLKNISPTNSWRAWRHLRVQRLDYRNTPAYLENRARHKTLSYYLYAGWAISVIGLLLSVGSTFLSPRR